MTIQCQRLERQLSIFGRLCSSSHHLGTILVCLRPAYRPRKAEAALTRSLPENLRPLRRITFVGDKDTSAVG